MSFSTALTVLLILPAAMCGCTQSDITRGFDSFDVCLSTRVYYDMGDVNVSRLFELEPERLSSKCECMQARRTNLGLDGATRFALGSWNGMAMQWDAIQSGWPCRACRHSSKASATPRAASPRSRSCLRQTLTSSSIRRTRAHKNIARSLNSRACAYVAFACPSMAASFGAWTPHLLQV
jgi:hypothetical protein